MKKNLYPTELKLPLKKMRIETSHHENSKKRRNESKLNRGYRNHKPNTVKMTLVDLPEGNKSFSKQLEFVHSWDHHFCCHGFITTLKVKVNCKHLFFEKSIFLFNLFALKVIINNKWSLCKLIKIRTQIIGQKLEFH